MSDLLSEAASDISSDIFDEENKESEDFVSLEQFATDDHFAATLELLQLPPPERSRENVECIFELVRDNKFFADLDAEMSLELCRHMTYTTMKADRVLFYKGDPADNWYLILAGSAGVFIEELKDPPAADGEESGGSVETRKRRVDKTSCVARLGEGHSFGELGLIRNDVRSAALLTFSDCLFLTLDKKSFQHCLGNFLKQKSDDKVQTLRQVLPGAKELRKLVVEQLTYFFKEATMHKDVALSTEGTKEDTLYLIVKGECVLRTRRRRYVGDFHSICAGEGEGELAVASISRVVDRARRQQKDKKGACDSGRPATAGNRSDSFLAVGDLPKATWNEQCAESATRSVRAKKPSVLLEELDLALLQEGCIVNFCSVVFDSPEPFSVVAFSSKTQVFSITKAELFKHMPPNVLEAVRLTGLILLQHLEKRIGQQEERIRHLELIHQRDATQGTGDVTTTEDNSNSGAGASGSSHFLLPLTFSPFLSKTMEEYIDASSIALEGHFDRFTRNLLCFQPHTAVLNHCTFRLLHQQMQRRQQRQRSLQPGAQQALEDSQNQQGNEAENAPFSQYIVEETGVLNGSTLTAITGHESAASTDCFIQAQKQVATLGSPVENTAGAFPSMSCSPVLQGQVKSPTPDQLNSGLWKSFPAHPLQGPTFLFMEAPLAVSNQPSIATADRCSSSETSGSPGTINNGRKKRDALPGYPEASAVEADDVTQTIAAREAAACASSALALGHPIISDSALEFFFRNISRDAVNINNKFCCHYQSKAQVRAASSVEQAAFQKSKQAQTNRLAARQTAQVSRRHPAMYIPQSQEKDNSTLSPESDTFQSAKQVFPFFKASNGVIALRREPDRGGFAVGDNPGNVRRPTVPSLVTQALQRRLSETGRGNSTRCESSEPLLLQQQKQDPHHVVKSLEIPYLHLLLEGQDFSRKKDRSVSLRGMAAAMQLFSSSVQRKTGKSALQADACEAPIGASACTGRRMLAQQVALRLHAKRNDGP